MSNIGTDYSSKRSGRVRVRTFCADHQPGRVSYSGIQLALTPTRIGPRGRAMLWSGRGQLGPARGQPLHLR